MHGGLPVAGVIHATDVEVVAVAAGESRAGSSLDSLLNGFIGTRGGVGAGVPEDGVAIKAADIVSGIRPGDGDGIISGPGA